MLAALRKLPLPQGKGLGLAPGAKAGTVLRGMSCLEQQVPSWPRPDWQARTVLVPAGAWPFNMPPSVPVLLPDGARSRAPYKPYLRATLRRRRSRPTWTHRPLRATHLEKPHVPQMCVHSIFK